MRDFFCLFSKIHFSLLTYLLLTLYVYIFNIKKNSKSKEFGSNTYQVNSRKRRSNHISSEEYESNAHQANFKKEVK
ncbi:unnamed protein product [Rhizophagus irregularis]|nr:unnamed protein product [Rhizophagus irregularis]